MKLSRVQEVLKILKSSAEIIYLEEKPKTRKVAKGKQTKATQRKPR
jgi:hypothetical protein